MKADAGRLDPAATLKNLKGILLYGSDTSIRDYIIQAFKAHISITPLSEAAFLDNPHEHLTPDLFADPNARRGFSIDEATDKNLKTYQALLHPSLQPSTDTFLILTSLKLRSASTLVSFFTKTPFLAAVPCYSLTPSQMTPLITRTAQELGLILAPPLLSLLSRWLTPETVVENLTRLSFYMTPGVPVTEEDLHNCLQGAEAVGIELAYALSASKPSELIRCLDTGSSTEPLTLVRQGTRHFMNLLRVRLSIDAGGRIDAAMKELRPPIFFKQAPQFKAHLAQWTAPQLYAALEHLRQAEVSIKQSQGDAIWKNKLFQIAKGI